MKTKNSQSPLRLKKKTIANLDDKALSKVLGGACTYLPSGCNTIEKCCSIFLGTCTLIPYCVTDPGCPTVGCPTTEPVTD